MKTLRNMLGASALALATLATTACGGRGLPCEDNTRYWNTPSGVSLRIPDDLSVPDQSGGLRIPPGQSGPRPEPVPGECLESPPDFFAD